MKITVESAPDKIPGEFRVEVTIDGDGSEHFWFETDERDALRVMHEVATMVRHYFIFQKEGVP